MASAKSATPAKSAAPKAAAAPKGKAAPSKAAKPAAAPVPAVPAPAVAPVALRGGVLLQSVTLSGKPYRVAAAHNKAWWDTTQKAIAAGGGKAAVADITKAGVPAIMVGYLYRRGYLLTA